MHEKFYEAYARWVSNPPPSPSGCPPPHPCMLADCVRLGSCVAQVHEEGEVQAAAKVEAKEAVSQTEQSKAEMAVVSKSKRGTRKGRAMPQMTSFDPLHALISLILGSLVMLLLAVLTEKVMNFQASGGGGSEMYDDDY